jgi:hypothetical protein
MKALKSEQKVAMLKEKNERKYGWVHTWET